MWFGGSLEGMQCYAVLEADLLRREIIGRNVCIASSTTHTGYCPVAEVVYLEDVIQKDVIQNSCK